MAATESLEGKLLIASPHLDDAQFARSVILIVHQDEEEGCFGLMLNRPAHETVGDVWAQFSEDPCECQQPADLGGPAPGPLLALHAHQPFADVEVVPQVYLAVDRANLEWVVRQTSHPFRLFLGTANWDAGYLEEEVAEGDWLVLPARPEDVFEQHEDLWQEALRAYGRRFYESVLGIKYLAADPSWN